MLFWTNTLIDVLLFIYVIDCAFMGLVIMMQRSKQEGLGAAFGGGFTESMWGAQTSNVLVKATVWAAIIFFSLSITLARLYSHRATLLEKGSPVQQLLEKPVAPATATPATATPAPTTTPAVPATSPTAPANASTQPAPSTSAPAQPAGK
jgi:preprotein translocase subunit SecG